MTTVKEVAKAQEKPQVNKLHRTLDKTKSILMMFLVADEVIYNLLAIWIAHTYIFEKFWYTPYLNIWSAEEGSGKSTFFKWLFRLCRNPFKTSSSSSSALIRTVSLQKRTVLLDEFDTVFGKTKLTPDQNEIIAWLNGGFEYDGISHKTNKNTMEVEEFNSYCPKAFASIGVGVLPKTTSSRSIHLPVAREKPKTKTTRRRVVKVQATVDQIKKDFSEWAKETTCDEIEVPLPEDDLTDRGVDMYEPLFQIAHEAGGNWTKLLTESAKALSGRAENVILTGTQLLIDIHYITKDKADDEWIQTTDLIEELCKDEFEDSGWGVYSKGTPIHARALKKLLEKYSIPVKRITRGSGYVVRSFRKPIKHYAMEHIRRKDKEAEVDLPPELSAITAIPSRNTMADVVDKTEVDSFRKNAND